MQVTDWNVDDGIICLVSQSGDRIFPTAQQIWSAVFRGVEEISGSLPRLSLTEALPQFSFSRFPAESVIVLTGDGTTQGVVVSTEVRTAAGITPLRAGHDQIIADGVWYPVDTSILAATNAWLSHLGIPNDTPATWGQLIALRAAENPPVAIVDNCSVTASGLAGVAGARLGEIQGLKADLYPYQRDGVAFMDIVTAQGLGCVLADEMGLGKTLQVIALLQSEKNRSSAANALIVCPATIVENWRRELTQFAPDLSVCIHTGARRAGLAHQLHSFDVVITSYDIAVRDELLLGAINWNIVAADEAQAIKNPDAQRTAAVKRLPRRVSVAITGTPMENRLDDLWSISDFVLPGLLGPVTAFRAVFTDELDDAQKLAPLVAPILLRRRVAEVAKDLPSKIEIPQPIVMSRRLAEAYETLRQETLDEYGPSAGLVSTTRLRVLCAHPLLTGSWDEDLQRDVPKYIRLLEILEEVFASGEKALIFTTYQGMTDLFMRDIPLRWPAGYFRFIDGRVPVPQRQQVVDEFYNWKGPGALFLNPKAAGAGLNITAANHVIHYNPEWNPALTDQASARSYRRKQQLPVTIHHFFYTDSIEELMLERAGFKRDLAERAVTGHDGSADPALIMRALEISPIARFRNEDL